MPNPVFFDSFDPTSIQGYPQLTTPILPIRTVTTFLEEIRGLLDNLVYYWDQIFFKDMFRQRIKFAWNNVRAQIQRVIDDLGNTAGNLASQLGELGLSPGPQLDLKLATINDAWNYINKRGMTVGLEILLEGISVFLESMSKEFPYVESIKEFVDYLKYAITLTKNIPPGDLSHSGIY